MDAGMEASKVIELQDIVEKQANEIVMGRNKIIDYSGKVRDLEDSMAAAQKEVSRLQQENTRLSRDLREVLLEVSIIKLLEKHFLPITTQLLEDTNACTVLQATHKKKYVYACKTICLFVCIVIK